MRDNNNVTMTPAERELSEAIRAIKEALARVDLEKKTTGQSLAVAYGDAMHDIAVASDEMAEASKRYDVEAYAEAERKKADAEARARSAQRLFSLESGKTASPISKDTSRQLWVRYDRALHEWYAETMNRIIPLRKDAMALSQQAFKAREERDSLWAQYQRIVEPDLGDLSNQLGEWSDAQKDYQEWLSRNIGMILCGGQDWHP